MHAAPGGIVIKRLTIVAALLLFPLAATAQPLNELGVFISTSQFEDSEITDGLDTIEFDFDEDVGYGLLYNRFWTNSFSTEFAYQQIGADVSGSFQDITADLGGLDLDILSATGQIHFARSSLFSPYLGGGVAYISGEAGSIDQEELENTDLQDEVEFLANVGLNVIITPAFSFYVDGKYILYEARGEDDEAADPSLDINPLIISGGVRFRF
jgi:outer membrane protein W